MSRPKYEAFVQIVSTSFGFSSFSVIARVKEPDFFHCRIIKLVLSATGMVAGSFSKIEEWVF